MSLRRGCCPSPGHQQAKPYFLSPPPRPAPAHRWKRGAEETKRLCGGMRAPRQTPEGGAEGNPTEELRPLA